jgi:hypothetical protein
MAVQPPHILPSLVVPIRELQVRASTYLSIHIGRVRCRTRLCPQIKLPRLSNRKKLTKNTFMGKSCSKEWLACREGFFLVFKGGIEFGQVLISQ